MGQFRRRARRSGPSGKVVRAPKKLTSCPFPAGSRSTRKTTGLPVCSARRTRKRPAAVGGTSSIPETPRNQRIERSIHHGRIGAATLTSRRRRVEASVAAATSNGPRCAETRMTGEPESATGAPSISTTGRHRPPVRRRTRSAAMFRALAWKARRAADRTARLSAGKPSTWAKFAQRSARRERHKRYAASPMRSTTQQAGRSRRGRRIARPKRSPRMRSPLSPSVGRERILPVSSRGRATHRQRPVILARPSRPA